MANNHFIKSVKLRNAVINVGVVIGVITVLSGVLSILFKLL